MTEAPPTEAALLLVGRLLGRPRRWRLVSQVELGVPVSLFGKTEIGLSKELKLGPGQDVGFGLGFGVKLCGLQAIETPGGH